MESQAVTLAATGEFWRHRPVLVTGCTGLLGSWMADALVRLGARVVGLVRDSVPATNFERLSLADCVVTVRGELEDYELVRRVVNEYEIDTVFHLGAQTIVTIANRDPRSTFEANIKGTWNVLEACRGQSQVKRVIVASSDKAYGDQTVLPYQEDAPLQGRHPYDVSKSCADLLAQSYFATYKLPVCITRCGNLFGGGDLNFNRLVPGTIRSVFEGESPIIRSNGKPIRDYLFVQDAVRGYLLLAERMSDIGCFGEAFNFSLEQPMSVHEFTREILGVMGRPDLLPVVLDQASAEIENQYLAAGKARRLLQWQPAFTLREGLRETVRWYEEFFRDSRRIDHPAASNS